MSRVLQAVDSIHSVGLYCLALVPHNHLPKTPLGGIHLSETKKRFLEGTLHPVNVLMCPHTCVTNLPKPREIHSDVGPASVIVGNLVQVSDILIQDINKKISTLKYTVGIHIYNLHKCNASFKAGCNVRVPKLKEPCGSIIEDKYLYITNTSVN